MKKFLFSFLFFTASLLSGEDFAPETLIKTTASLFLGSVDFSF